MTEIIGAVLGSLGLGSLIFALIIVYKYLKPEPFHYIFTRF